MLGVRGRGGGYGQKGVDALLCWRGILPSSIFVPTTFLLDFDFGWCGVFTCPSSTFFPAIASFGRTRLFG